MKMKEATEEGPAVTEESAIVEMITTMTSTILKVAADMATITDTEVGKIQWVGVMRNMAIEVERIMEMTGIPVAI